MQRESGTDDARARELALVARLREGDRAAFERVYVDHQARIFSFLLRLSGRRDVAEDLAQETWIKLARSAPRLLEDTRLSPLLFTIARNAFLSWRRWAMLDLSRLVMLGFDAGRDAAAPGPDLLHERQEDLVILEHALQKLPVAAREVLLLVGVEGFEQEEAARILGLEFATLRKRLGRARADLESTIALVGRQRATLRKKTA